MTIPHPLYDKLLQRVNESSNKNIDINRLSVTINNISKNSSHEESNFHYKWIKSLIIHHALLHENLSSSIFYNCKVMPGDNGELYTTSNLPPLLQQIIAEYIDYSNY